MWKNDVLESKLLEKATKYGQHLDGFGGLVVSMLASGSRVRGFKAG
jgi:hypothetical protein